MIYNIQALRALAATIVILAHLFPALAALGFHRFGGQGVDLFFVISGFIMVSTTRVSRPTPIAFLRARLTRIVPAYWAMTFVMFAAAMIFPKSPESTSASLPDLVRSLLFIPFLKGGRHVTPLLFVGWTLNYEMIFYALFAIGLSFVSYLRGMIFVLAALAAAAAFGAAYRPAETILSFYSSPVILEFGFGAVVGMMASLIKDTPRPCARELTVLVLAVSIICLFAFPYLNVFGGFRIFQAGIPSMAIVACALALERWGMSVRNTFLIEIGNASYVVYLTHVFIILPSSMIFHPSASHALIDVGFIIAEIGMSLTVGVVVHARVERPFLRWLRSANADARVVHARSLEGRQSPTAR
jgi:peptidoglycan/LPS O-acetylase OafA/YrhL